MSNQNPQNWPSNPLLQQFQSLANFTLAQGHQTFLQNLAQLRRDVGKKNHNSANSKTEQNQSQSQKHSNKKKSKKLTIGTGKGNFPTIYEAYSIPRQKKIKKKKIRSNDRLIKRIPIDLINISSKIEEEIARKTRNKYVRPTNSRKAYNQHLQRTKKLTKIKKQIQTIKMLNQAQPQASSVKDELKADDVDLPYPISESERALVRDKPNQLAFRLRRILNNTPEVKRAYDPTFEIREYIDNILTKELDFKVLKLINHLNFSQLLKKRLEPFKYKKRLVYGFNEVTKSLEMTRTEV